MRGEERGDERNEEKRGERREQRRGDHGTRLTAEPPASGSQNHLPVYTISRPGLPSRPKSCAAAATNAADLPNHTAPLCFIYSHENGAAAV